MVKIKKKSFGERIKEYLGENISTNQVRLREMTKDITDMAKNYQPEMDLIAQGEVTNNCGYHFVESWGAAQGFGNYKGQKIKVYVEKIKERKDV